jgi:hypothetical protein
MDDRAADARAVLLEDLDLLQRLLVAAQQQHDNTMMQAVLAVAGERQARLDEIECIALYVPKDGPVEQQPPCAGRRPPRSAPLEGHREQAQGRRCDRAAHREAREERGARRSVLRGVQPASLASAVRGAEKAPPEARKPHQQDRAESEHRRIPPSR